MRKPNVVLGVALAVLLPALAAGVSAPQLVADLATTVSERAGSNPAEFVRLGGIVLFTAQPDDHARRLYRSDGTAEGTEELASGCGPLATGGFSLAFATATRAFYAVVCGSGGEALWVSDGTAAGTRVLLAAGAYGSPGAQVASRQWIEDGDSLYFLQRGRYNGPLELWRTDGTAPGTEPLAVLSASDHVSGGLVRRGAGDLLLVVAEDFGDLAVWRSDGTAAGTQQGAAIAFPDQHPSLRSLAPTAGGLAVLVSVFDPSRVELWYSDGTPAGTALGATLDYGMTDSLLADSGSIFFLAEVEGEAWLWRGDGTASTTRAIVPLGSREARSEATEFVDGALLLVACASDQRSCELLRAPRSEGAATSIATVCKDAFCSRFDAALWVREVGGRIVTSRKSAAGVAVWTSDADGGSAVAVAPLCPSEFCFGPSVEPLLLDGRVFFSPIAADESSRELWSSDGTPEGTLRHAGPLPALVWVDGNPERRPLAALPAGGWLFSGGEIGHGLELWRAGTGSDSGERVEDLRADRSGLLSVEAVGSVGPTFVFALTSADGNARTLYRHRPDDGPPEPFLTVPVQRGRHGIRNAPPTLRPAGNAWFFIEHDLGEELSFAEQIWRYDPESRDLRTVFAEDLRQSGVGARADDLLPSGADFLFLGSRDPELHPAIYRLRPRSGAVSKLFDLPAERATSIGQSGDFWYLVEDGERIVAIDLHRRTRAVVDSFPGASVGQAVTLAGGLLFGVERRAAGDRSGLELRQSTGSGTRLVAEWPETIEGCALYLELPPKGAASPALFAAQTYCDGSPNELWTSDGSFERTRRLRTFESDRLTIAPRADRWRGKLLFLASRYATESAPARYAIWASDGTEAGTAEVASLPVDTYPNLGEFAAAARGAEAVYFPWGDAAHGFELWRTDGTGPGTGLVEDLEPGPASSFPWQLAAVGDQVVFRAGTAATGLELWQVDGGFPTPKPVADLFPGIESSQPFQLAAVPDALYFLADDGVVGKEIWSISRPSVAPCVADATTLCLAQGRFRARAVRRDFEGELGSAGVVPLTGDSGYFWFFAPGNPEVLLKVVDACGLPGFENFWAYSTGLTNVEVELEVVDTLSGERKIVRTALGEAYGPLFDSGSFQVCAAGGGSAASGPASAPVAGAGSSTVLPLLDGRFEARASWRKRDGTTGLAAAVPLAGDSGFFWFFDPAIVEVLVKMVDACGFDGFDNFWVFAGGLTDVEVHLEVTDTWSGEVVRHDNLQGRPFASLLETGKLRACEAAPPLP